MKEAGSPSSLHLDRLCGSPSLSSDLTGTHRGKGWAEKIGLKWEETAARGDSVILGRLETAPRSTSTVCEMVLLSPSCFQLSSCPPAMMNPFQQSCVRLGNQRPPPPHSPKGSDRSQLNKGAQSTRKACSSSCSRAGSPSRPCNQKSTKRSWA